MMRIALLEDDPDQARSMAEALAGSGRTVLHCTRGSELFRRVAQERVGAFVVDWRLPDMEGAAVIQRLRQIYGRTLPLIVVTSDRHESVALAALALDADDFVYKPVTRAVLRARLEAVLRRYQREDARCDVLRLGPYALDRRTRQALCAGVPVGLKAREFDLAWLLLSNPHRFMSKAELIAGLWGTEPDAHSHSLAQHMYALRRKLQLAEQGFRLQAVYGAGYRLDPPATTATAASAATATTAASSVSPAAFAA